MCAPTAALHPNSRPAAPGTAHEDRPAIARPTTSQSAPTTALDEQNPRSAAAGQCPSATAIRAVPSLCERFTPNE